MDGFSSYTTHVQLKWQTRLAIYRRRLEREEQLGQLFSFDALDDRSEITALLRLGLEF